MSLAERTCLADDATPAQIMEDRLSLFASVLANFPMGRLPRQLIGFGKKTDITPGHPLWNALQKFAEVTPVEVLAESGNGTTYIPWHGDPEDCGQFIAVRIAGTHAID
jgi:hypothetical protein